MCAAINRSLDSGRVELIQPAFYQSVDRGTLGELLVGDQGVQIPLLDQRVSCLNQVSCIFNHTVYAKKATAIKKATPYTVCTLYILYTYIANIQLIASTPQPKHDQFHC